MVLFFKIKQIQFVTIRKYFADKQKEKIKHIEQDYLLKKVTHMEHVHTYRNHSKYEHNYIECTKCGH